MAGADTAGYIERNDGRLRIRLRVTPNARNEGFSGVFTDADGQKWLKASVRAVPEGGKANAAVIGLLCGRAGMAKSELSLVQGAASRYKIVEMPDRMEAALALTALA